jgi:hypothetical protein
MKRLILLLTLATSAGPWFFETGWAQGSYDPIIAEMIATVSDSSMYQCIADLQSFGTRYTFDPNRDTVARWVQQSFLSAGLTDVVMDTLTPGLDLVNVVATIHGISDTEIVVGAHYDCYSPNLNIAPGADDNASGMAAVVEIARVLSTFGYTPESTIRFVGFAAEEQGVWGSNAYAEKAYAKKTNIRAMLNFDMIGYRDIAQGDMDFWLVWYLGAEAESLAAMTTTITRQYTTLNPILYTGSRNRSDSFSFAAAGYPAVFWLGCDSYLFYHTPYDSLQYLDVDYAAEITRSALALLLTLEESTDDVKTATTAVPTSARLDQNYPNPFNPSTTIAYSIPGSRESGVGSMETKLVVYDILGREVAVLVNEKKAPGSYEVKFDATALSSGVYFYCLQAGKFMETKKLVVLR